MAVMDMEFKKNVLDVTANRRGTDAQCSSSFRYRHSFVQKG